MHFIHYNRSIELLLVALILNVGDIVSTVFMIEGEHDVTKWISVENGVQLEVTLSYSDKKALVKHRSKSNSFFSSFRRSKVKL